MIKRRFIQVFHTHYFILFRLLFDMSSRTRCRVGWGLTPLSPPRTEHTTFTVHPLSSCVRRPPESIPGLRSSLDTVTVTGSFVRAPGHMHVQPHTGDDRRTPFLPGLGNSTPAVLPYHKIRLCSRHPLPPVTEATQRY